MSTTKKNQERIIPSKYFFVEFVFKKVILSSFINLQLRLGKRGILSQITDLLKKKLKKRSESLHEKKNKIKYLNVYLKKKKKRN